MIYREFVEAGFRVFPLWPFKGDVCGCDNPNCQAPGKHPRASNWQHTPEWDDEQIDAMEAAGHFASGYGVLCRGWLVVDVDARNGGLESYARLVEAVPDVAEAGLIVTTGSGGGSRHLYFSLPGDPVAMVQHLPEYPGLDFKTSGFVVGPGSRHVSGGSYAIGYGSPDDVTPAPAALVDMLRKPDRHRAEFDGRVVDVSHADIADMLAPIEPDCDYETWIRIGMAIHHATGGTGLAVWDAWSANGGKYDAKAMDAHWHSFGRCANPVTLGTLVHHAEAAGWRMPVTFTPEDEPQGAHVDGPGDGLPFDVSGVDLTSPPGFVGDVARWIEDQSRRPRKRLAVAGALVAMGNVAGLRYTDDRDGVTANLFAFCVAGSRTGKEAIQQAVAEVHRAAGLAGATHGAIKSEQEIVRNLIRHQAALYVVDEIGIFLQKIRNAQNKGGALYLDGVIGMLMAAYSKADGFMLLTGDAKDDLRGVITKEAAQIQKRLDDGENNPHLGRRLAQIQAALDGLDNGLDRPFLSLIGFTTPVTFDELVDYQSATNGFIGRALMFNERETAPRTKPGFRKRAMGGQMAATIAQVFSAGEFDMQASPRVEFYGKRSRIPTDAKASVMLDAALDWFEDQAEQHKSRTGLEALYLGAYEIVSKVSLILACPEGRRTAEHVRWAFALVRRDIEEKSLLVTANDRQKDAPKVALQARIMALLSGEDGETIGVIKNRLRKFKPQDVQKCLDDLVAAGMVVCQESNAEGPGRRSIRFKSSQ
jgi:hypothetical protein